MTIKIKIEYILTIIPLAILVLVLHNTQYWPVYNNNLKPHRWRSQSCIANHIDRLACAIQIPVPCSDVNKRNVCEVAYFDVDLESGELRRIQ